MKNEKLSKSMNIVFLLVLAVFPLRHAAYGIDLQDVGYNYVNFLNFGSPHMDSMWMFSTYAATLAGHLMSLLPFGHTLLGLNIYTGLVLSLTAVISYRYVVKRLGLGIVPAFLGEFLAECFCWCPTALLYNYLTYLFLVLCLICLEKGLLEEKPLFLLGAGALLGLNVFVRFSNLPQAGLIVGVWAVGWIEAHSKRDFDASVAGKPTGTLWSTSGALKRTLRRTGFCMAGYVSAVLLILGILALFYGAGAYFDGIRRLLSMTEEASDYTAFSMLYSVYLSYRDELYWMIRILFFLVCGLAASFIARVLVNLFVKTGRKKQIADFIVVLFSLSAAAAMVVWLYRAEYASSLFYSYDSMIRPATLFLMISELVLAGTVFYPGAGLKIRTICGFVFLTLVISSVGSNNGVMSGFNNLFLAAPLMFGFLFSFLKNKQAEPFPLFHVKAVCVGLAAICIIQGIGFAKTFVFAEGTGIQGALVKNTTLKRLTGIRLRQDRNEALTNISGVISAYALQDSEVLLYGDIPAAAFYLELTPVFNPWPDLRSYSTQAFAEAMEKMREHMEADENYRPMILLGRKEITKIQQEKELPAKIRMIFEIMEHYPYEKLYEDEFFVLYADHPGIMR